MTLEDPIVEEIRRHLEEYAARFNHNLQVIFEDLKRQQEQSGLTYVDYSNGCQKMTEQTGLKKAS